MIKLLKKLTLAIMIQLSMAKPLAQKGPIVVHRGNSRDFSRGHSFDEVKFLLANFNRNTFGLERFKTRQARKKFHLPSVTTDDEEILQHLMKHNLVSRPRYSPYPYYHQKISRKTARKIPASVFKNFRHLIANLPSEYEGSGY